MRLGLISNKHRDCGEKKWLTQQEEHCVALDIVGEGTAFCYDKKLLNNFQLVAKIHRSPLWFQNLMVDSLVGDTVQERKEDNVLGVENL